MRSFCVISALLAFVLGCAETELVARKERLAKTQEEPSVEPATTMAEQKGSKRESDSAVQPRPDREVTGKQEGAGDEKNATQGLVREVIAGVERSKAAATKAEEAAEDAMILGITGLIMEETMTKIGYDFYEYFFILWEAPQGITVQDYNIFIHERASPVWGSLVRVDINEITIWNKIVKPRGEEIEQAAKEAIQVARMYLINYEQYQFQSEDMVGTGI